jgi:hypothetical protein
LLFNNNKHQMVIQVQPVVEQVVLMEVIQIIIIINKYIIQQQKTILQTMSSIDTKNYHTSVVFSLILFSTNNNPQMSKIS